MQAKTSTGGTEGRGKKRATEEEEEQEEQVQVEEKEHLNDWHRVWSFVL